MFDALIYDVLMLCSLAKRFFRALGLRVGWASRPENRFDAMGEALGNLVHLGFVPAVVIDGGANVGQWSTLASGIFPGARFHVIEPQPGCWPALEARFTSPRFSIHRTAITSPNVAEVRMISAATDQRNTGAWVAPATGFADELSAIYPSTTLDNLVGPAIAAGDRVLLKLDVERHEISVLDGAAALLPRIEVIVSEVSFFDIHRIGGTTFTGLLNYLDARGFDLYDFAALAPRPRDNRLRMGDAIFVRRGTPLLEDANWE